MKLKDFENKNENIAIDVNERGKTGADYYNMYLKS